MRRRKDPHPGAPAPEPVIACPDCGLERKPAYALSGAPCVARGLVYTPPAPATAPEPAPRTASRREVQAAVAAYVLG